MSNPEFTNERCIGSKVVMAPLYVMSWHLTGLTEENHKNRQDNRYFS
jgi:hypothetical protein